MLLWVQPWTEPWIKEGQLVDNLWHQRKTTVVLPLVQLTQCQMMM
jgi:hypothetical protein